eukprot:gene15456-17040_t
MDCKKCPAGQYVPPNRAPGKSPTDCQTCPDGIPKNKSAGYRAGCKCLDEFTHLDRFGKCTKCDQRGIQCKHDYPILKPGYWWDWQGNAKCKNSFIAFMKNLDIEDDSYIAERQADLIGYSRKFQNCIKCPKPSHELINQAQQRGMDRFKYQIIYEKTEISEKENIYEESGVVGLQKSSLLNTSS